MFSNAMLIVLALCSLGSTQFNDKAKNAFAAEEAEAIPYTFETRTVTSTTFVTMPVYTTSTVFKTVATGCSVQIKSSSYNPHASFTIFDTSMDEPAYTGVPFMRKRGDYHPHGEVVARAAPTVTITRTVTSTETDTATRTTTSTSTSTSTERTTLTATTTARATTTTTSTSTITSSVTRFLTSTETDTRTATTTSFTTDIETDTVTSTTTVGRTTVTAGRNGGRALPTAP
ncbi:hypothetical protein OH77DRAFT_1517911 [Trametes cingulata]|nr:hypothetical protein OH77DRAFT_1517911 [Trametes cingulata]